MIFPFTDDKIMCNQLSPTNRKRCQTHHVGCYLVLINISSFMLQCSSFSCFVQVYRMGGCVFIANRFSFKTTVVMLTQLSISPETSLRLTVSTSPAGVRLRESLPFCSWRLLIICISICLSQ